MNLMIKQDIFFRKTSNQHNKSYEKELQEEIRQHCISTKNVDMKNNYGSYFPSRRTLLETRQSTVI